MKVFQKTNLDWCQAYVLLTKGITVKRASWRPAAYGVFIKDLNSNRGFFTIKTSFAETNWQPYHKDFGATDWRVVEAKENVVERVKNFVSPTAVEDDLDQ